MKNISRMAAAGAAAALAVGLAGCGSGSAAEGDDVTLTWWATQQTPSLAVSEEAWDEVAATYKEETGVTVDVEIIPWADLYNRILTAVTSGSGPDLINIGTTWVGTLHDAGALAPVTETHLETLGGSERFIPSVWEASHVPGEDHTTVPLIGSVHSLYYNTAMFAEAGITEPPATWDEFVEIGKQLTVDTDGDGTIDQWGFTASAAAGVQNTHRSFTLGRQEGGELVDDEGNPTLTDPAQVAGVERYVNFMAKDGIMSPSDAEISQEADIIDKFVNGAAAMMISQNPTESFLSRGFDDWAIAPMPTIAGREDFLSPIGGTNISVFEDSDQQTEAFEFIAFLTSPEEQAKLAAAFIDLPVVTEAFDLEPLVSSDDRTLETRRQVITEGGLAYPLFPVMGDIEVVLGQAVADAFQAYATGGDSDVRGRLEAAQAQLD